MATKLNWRPHVLVSTLHAAEASARGAALADVHLGAAIQEPSAMLAGEMRANQISTTRLWRHLIPLAANLDNRRQLAETAVRKVVGRVERLDAIASALSGAIVSVEAAVRRVLPKLAEELPLRERPLREQWEGRGPGLLHQLGLVTEERLIPQQCDVLLVHPALGGAGTAHKAYNSLRIEAVLANPVAEVPEVVRLAWLIGQLQLDLPIYSDHVHADRLPHVAGFAILPAVLAAAERVELARLDERTVQQAIAAWHLTSPPDIDSSTVVLQWWDTYTATRPPWPVALAALDQMFG